MIRATALPVVVLLLTCSTLARAQAPGDAKLRDDALAAIRKGVAFYHGKVAAHGGYVYRYSDDLTKREGEGKTGPDTVWVQPPGTPAVGLAYVDAYERTREPALLDAARAAGACLVKGQFRSGGWNDRVEFGPAARAKVDYRVDAGVKKKRPFNVSTFDDDKTQSAVRFLVRLDQALGRKDPAVHEAVTFALESILKAQHPNGAWGQGWDAFPDPAQHPVKPASVPDPWPRDRPGGVPYWFFYTFNDDAVSDTVDALLLAARAYDEPRYRAAAMKAGDFILLAQLPEPQPAWAQQYDFDMRPAWARKFEPPAVSGSESQNLLRTLVRLYVESGDAKYLKPVPPALAYLARSKLPDGRLARFYELGTNKPLYFTKAYELTHDDADLPTHYGFKVGSELDEIAAEYARASKLTPAEREARRSPPARRAKPTPELAAQVRKVIAAMDERGAWVEDGRLKYHGPDDPTRRVIESRTFVVNLAVLARYVEATGQ